MEKRSERFHKGKENIEQPVQEWISDSCGNVRMTYAIIEEMMTSIPQTIITKTMQPNYSGLMFSFWPHYMCFPKLESSSSGSTTCNCKWESLLICDIPSLKIVTDRFQNMSTKSWKSFKWTENISPEIK